MIQIPPQGRRTENTMDLHQPQLGPKPNKGGVITMDHGLITLVINVKNPRETYPLPKKSNSFREMKAKHNSV